MYICTCTQNPKHMHRTPAHLLPEGLSIIILARIYIGNDHFRQQPSLRAGRERRKRGDCISISNFFMLPSITHTHTHTHTHIHIYIIIIIIIIIITRIAMYRT